MAQGIKCVDALPRRIPSSSPSVRTACSGSFGVACRPADIRSRHYSRSVVAILPSLTARRIAICRGGFGVSFAAKSSQGGCDGQDGTECSAIHCLLVKARAVRGSASVSLKRDCPL